MKCDQCGQENPADGHTCAPERLQCNHQWISTGAMAPGECRCVQCGTWGNRVYGNVVRVTREQLAELFPPPKIEVCCGEPETCNSPCVHRGMWLAAQPALPPAAPGRGCDFCNHQLYVGTKCKNCGLATPPAPVRECLAHGECFGGKCIYTATPAQPAPVQDEFPLRGILASELKCWHRLTEDEQINLLAFVKNTRPAAQPAVPPEQLLALLQTASQELDKVIKVFEMAPLAAPVQCEWCNGRGVLAGYAQDGSFDGEDCPHCTPPAQPDVPTNCRHCGGPDNVLCAGQCKVAAQPAPVPDATAEEWKDAAWKVWKLARTHNNTIPSHWLDRMRELVIAAATTAQPAPVPLTDGVLVPLTILEAAEASLGSFCSDHGWSDKDMHSMDSLSAYIARHKAAHGITKGGAA